MSSARGMAEYTKPVLAGFAGLTVAGIGCSGAAAGNRAFSDLRCLMDTLQGSIGRFMLQLLLAELIWDGRLPVLTLRSPGECVIRESVGVVS